MSSDTKLGQSKSFSPSGWFRSSKIATWEIVGVIFINCLGAYLHFAFELSGFNKAVALFASVNESTWEHLKFYFWASLLFALIEYTYVRKVANNFIFAKAVGILLIPIFICISFYGYLQYALPVHGKGFLWADISTGVIGVIVGQLASSYIMQMQPLRAVFKRIGIGMLAAMLIMFSTFTFFPPKMFLFEDYMGYEYKGQYGILDDYTDYLIFD